jgi:hypothetical protein
MGSRVSDHVRRNAVGYVAVFLALSGTAAALPGKNKVDSGDIKPANVRSSDLASNSVGSAAIVDNSVTGGDVNEQALGKVQSAANSDEAADADLLDGHDSSDFLGAGTAAGGDLSGSYPNPAIAASAVGGEEVGDNSLTGDDVDESSLKGLTTAVGDSGCCRIQGEVFSQATDRDPAVPTTITDFGQFELRSTTTGGDADSFDLCNTSIPGMEVYLYTGGAEASTADTRSSPFVPSNTCVNLDFNGADSDGEGNFRLELPVDNLVVHGFSQEPAGTNTSIVAFGGF